MKRGQRLLRQIEQGTRARRPSISRAHFMNLKSSDVESHSKFIQALLQECATKVKRTVVLMMGNGAIHTMPEGAIGFENTMVASLCDLVERMFRHGLRECQGKSPLWYVLGHVEGSGLPEELTESISCVEKMPFLMSDVGRARAWLRLALEKKTLSRLLEHLFSKNGFLRGLYKPYAFAAHEDVQVQVVSHFLSLTTVDFLAFSANYPPATITYRIAIHTARKFRSGTSANVSITLHGEYRKLGPIIRKKGATFNTGACDEFEVTDQNLGILQSVEIGHDNQGLSPGWTLDRVLVTNKLTNHCFCFPCGGRLDSTNNTLRLSCAAPPEEKPAKKSSTLRSGKEPLAAEQKNMQDEICEQLACSINALVRYFHSEHIEQCVLTQAYLTLGPMRILILAANLSIPDHVVASGEQFGLTQVLFDVLQNGFKSKAIFGSQRHVWDFIEKVAAEKKDVQLASDPAGILVSSVGRANSSSAPKTARFEWLMCSGATRHVLHVWIELFAHANCVTTYYEPTALIRSEDRLMYLTEMLRYLVDFPFNLQDSIVYLQPDEKGLGRWRLKDEFLNQ
eukprot:m.155953 g.155953  ORF g.155953 m.155953 type:complete len:566 (+) comp24672_c0_seq1:239-1936(+)